MHTFPIYGNGFIEISYLVPIRCICDMCALFRNRYVIGTKRYNGYDYSLPGKYFVTICTKNKKPDFGKIENGEIKLSDIGIIARDLWIAISDHFPNIELDEFIIMPDHIHGIISINTNFDDIVVETRHASFLLQPPLHNKNEIGNPELHIKSGNQKTRISPKPGSLGAIVGSYKSAVSKIIHKSKPDFAWQPRYYDRIIRNHSQLSRIRKYIRENPQNWTNSG